MLHPRFFAPPNDRPIQPGQRFEVLWYSQVEDWTLVHWRLHYSSDGPNGSFEESECLYRKHKQIAHDRLRGELQLGEHQPPEKRPDTGDPRDRIDPNLGNYGLSPALASKLRSLENRRVFQG